MSNPFTIVNPIYYSNAETASHIVKSIFQAKEEMARQELRNKLSHADQDVMEAYKRISTARSKKKPPSKKEREQAWKALKEREIILKQLENI